MHPQLRELRLQYANARGEFALHRAHRGARGSRGACIDQIGDRFRLGEIHLAVQERPLAELAGTGHSDAQPEHTMQHPVDDECAAVTLQLEDMFAGERGGCGKVQGKPLVQRSPIRIAEAPQLRHPRVRQGTEKGNRHTRHVGA